MRSQRGITKCLASAPMLFVQFPTMRKAGGVDIKVKINWRTSVHAVGGCILRRLSAHDRQTLQRIAFQKKGADVNALTFSGSSEKRSTMRSYMTSTAAIRPERMVNENTESFASRPASIAPRMFALPGCSSVAMCPFFLLPQPSGSFISVVQSFSLFACSFSSSTRSLIAP